MSDCKIYPADTVDIYGNTWPSVGENIRYGLFGMKVKRGFIEIKSGNIKSTDFIISNVENSQFSIDKKAIIIFPLSCTAGFLSFRISLAYNGGCVLVSQVALKSISGTLGVIYLEE